MSNEIQAAVGRTGLTIYANIRTPTGTIWSTSGGVGGFSNYVTALFQAYAISLTEQGTASSYYLGTMPAAVPPGTYNIVAKQQTAGSPAEGDPVVAMGDLEWNGSYVTPLSDLATSGQLGQIGPIRLARGCQILNFPIYLKSSADHITPLTSGVVSGQIARDGSTTFGPLQSGSFVEVGNGFYTLSALTSGDLLATTVKLLFTANQVSGGPSDPLPMSFVLQRTSGQL